MANGPAAPASYAACGGGGAAASQGGIFKRTQRLQLNIYPVLICLFVPWCLFCTVFYALSFSLRHQHLLFSWGIVGVAAAATLICAGLAWHQKFGRGVEASERPPSWLIVCALSMALALATGIAAGLGNYAFNTRRYYDVATLMEYGDLSPSDVRGQQVMDAGVITFAEGARLDISRSMGFQNTGVYCVAPIVVANETPAAYDFWAVGRDCCSGHSADFHCPGFNNIRARSGLRLMEDDSGLIDESRAFYRLAVQQAEATYDIKAMHPLFFHWVADPAAEIDEWMAYGTRFYLAGVCGYFVLQSFLIAITTLSFSTLGQM